ncbi:MAG TPA: hypothetical protein VK971_10300 [Thiohalobacter sp.]|nr:hypothetical protein [Thiohalobacter sp.]
MFLAEPDVIGRPSVPGPTARRRRCWRFCAKYQPQGYEVWLELGLQSAFHATLQRVNRGHGFAEYRDTLLAARRRGSPRSAPT